jgi:hypothetical protein
VSALGEPAELWENISPQPQHWIILKLVGVRSNRDGIGALIRIGNQYAEMTTTAGYASSADCGVHFGLGSQEMIKQIEIRWPSGVVQRLENVKPDQVLTATEPGR